MKADSPSGMMLHIKMVILIQMSDGPVKYN